MDTSRSQVHGERERLAHVARTYTGEVVLIIDKLGGSVWWLASQLGTRRKDINDGGGAGLLQKKYFFSCHKNTTTSTYRRLKTLEEKELQPTMNQMHAVSRVL